MRKTPLTIEEINKIWEFYYDFSRHPILVKLYNTPQHRTSNTYRHVCLVTRLSLFHAIKKNLHYDYHSLIRGAFLHDLFFYNWRNDKKSRKRHLRDHPDRALANAKEVFDLTDKEIDIIRNHMWPINFSHFPRTKEGRLVMLMDKKATFIEVFNKKKDVLIFDLDGTLIDTIPDLNGAINYTCKQMGYPTREMEHTRRSIGHGIKNLVRVSIPEETSEEDYQKALDIFRAYYKEHAMDNSKPYEGMQDVLRRLRKRGYFLSVVTNKDEGVATKMINHFFPNLFQTVVGGGKLQPKPSYEMINELRNRITLRRRKKAAYIGDSEVDYLTAKNAMIKCYLVTYGYRTLEELQNNKVEAYFINQPTDLLDYFVR